MDPAPEAQTTDAVLMIRPCSFGWNAETADSNTYQSRPQEPPPRIQQQARQEFAGLRALLRQHGVTVTVLDDLPDPPAPDAVFPNNWFSTHADGTLVLYPMAAANRRGERRPTHLAALRQALGEVRMIDLTDFEASGKFLEGTGSLVLDRVHRIAYAAESARTDRVVVEAFARALGYRPLLFSTILQKGQPIYHTNVVMAIGTQAAVICLEAIAEGSQREIVAASIRQSGRKLIAITLAQLAQFAGNLLELRSQHSAALWVMSSRAFHALDAAQRQQLAASATLLHAPLPTIESVGGGSARCMIAELFCQRAPS